MPAPKNPSLPEFFVYRLETRGVPFYVGIGRSARASDRVRYVRYCMGREAKGKPVKWSLSGRAVARLIEAGLEVNVAYAAEGLVRSDAIAAERAEIARLRGAGYMLANLQHNPDRPASAEEVANAVLTRVYPVTSPIG